MKYALITDIHANAEALRAVLAKIDELQPDEVHCLGDVVGYCAHPAECVDMLRERNIHSLAGNHDRYVAHGITDKIRPETEAVIEFTREALDDDQLKWLSGLEDQYVLEREYLLVHGSPRDRDEYMLTEVQWKRNLKEMKSTYFGLDVCFYGHTHYPTVITKGHYETSITEDKSFPLKVREVYLINPGSVGQPRDRCTKASFCIFDSEAMQVHFHRVEYDIEVTQKGILDAGLARKLADRLAHGR